jgi:hypothetical protein
MICIGYTNGEMCQTPSGPCVSVTVEHETNLSQDETYKKVKAFFAESDSLKKLDSNLEYTFDDAAHTGKVKGSKFECNLKVLGSSPSKVQVTVSLSLLLTPFKGKIQETLRSKISQVFG